MKSKEKCMKVCKESLVAKKSVVIDNTNPTADVRQRYIDIAKEFEVPVRCLLFETPKDVCMHNNYQRKVNGHRKHMSKAVPPIPIHGFFKNSTKPSMDEGFEEILKVEFIPDIFQNENDKQFYFSVR